MTPVRGGIDVPDRLQRRRGDGGQPAARFGGDVGQHEELAPGFDRAATERSYRSV
jgi:hypothetical protein